MAIGSIINLGGGGGSLGGKGMIIVDTAAMTAGDTVRVRDVYDSQNVQNKNVVTAGTPLFFEVEPYCYYKICMVQTISDVEVEIGGEFTTIDVGQTVLATALNKATLGGHQGIINAHQEGTQLAIGDEVPITVNGAEWIMQVGNIDTTNHAVDYVSKYLWDSTQVGGNSNTSYATASPNYLKQKMEDFYNAMADKDKVLLKEVTKSTLRSDTSTYDTFTAKVYPPNIKEVNGNYPSGTPTIQTSQFAIFTTQANRIKTLNGTSLRWWTCDGYVGNSMWWWFVETTGVCSGTARSYAYGVLPCFRLIADS